MSSTRKLQKHSRGLMAIAVFKILEALALMAVGFGALHFLHRDLAVQIARWVDLLRIDPHSHYLHWILEKVAAVDEKKLRAFSVGTFIYSALFFCEGAGRALQKRWAEYLTIISTASLIPVEILEIFKKLSGAKVMLLLVNVAIVVYLIRELRTTRPAKQKNA